MGHGILKSRTAIAVLACALTAVAVGGVSYAVAAGTGGGATFYACASSTGAIRAASIRVGSPPTNCRTGESVQSWNEQGQPGAQGPVGQASVVNVSAPAACPAPAGTPTATGGPQAFLDIPTIPGESTDTAHRNQIDVLSWSEGVTGGAGSACGGAAGGKATFNEFTITKRVDKASPPLMLAGALGTNLGTITLHVAKQSVDYLTFKLDNALVSSTKVSWKNGDEGPTESVTFVFGALEISYTPQNPDGTPGSPVITCFNLASQTTC
jgi:type VI secretion system secreted protein Hcp